MEKIRFKDLSMPLKLGIIGGIWIFCYICFFLTIIMIGAILGMLSLI